MAQEKNARNQNNLTTNATLRHAIGNRPEWENQELDDEEDVVVGQSERDTCNMNPDTRYLSRLLSPSQVTPNISSLSRLIYAHEHTDTHTKRGQRALPEVSKRPLFVFVFSNYLHERKNRPIHVYVCVVQREEKWRTQFLGRSFVRLLTFSHTLVTRRRTKINNSLGRK